ncbi:hypothetical protein H5410_046320 [Solanum commersonii]|uniref:Uncharacterized protein n=1 Tax=Solanum commersonii TaxID=4109 RepID=A0A9J5XFC3_SOLCO|nr:hypothetical protein H5410_046320 [Solanum commersonii]
MQIIQNPKGKVKKDREGVKKVPDLLGAVVDVSTDNVWVTGYTTVSIRSSKSLNMPSSLLSCVSSASIDITSLLVSLSDSACAASSPCTSLVVSGASLSSALFISEVKSVDLR